ncbi:hypothetical protein [Paraburkholderia aspalathi]|uniref:hypothetical protein n=1 Tax=Paraburkholderia aspalathi TaxID=1324617 RepID=UPI00190E4062|nr:hypothetical protein [Paraburkholderia aspalathi]MBK3823581.1 hypothetical protein [Paraburkholderia aspalathi]MBK3835411.1 hypothetical protein [Paraburkholderia aspalathi]MBK3865163.1 hypothetical protein [Paraburkholderia aspalathi]
MIAIILDTNIYDRLERDDETVAMVNALIACGAVEILKPRQVADELSKRPNPLPDLFPTRVIGHSVGRAGIICAGDFLGNGAVYDEHKGKSRKDADAFIVDVCSWVADWFVTEDNRCFARFPTGTRCTPLRFQAFCERLVQIKKETEEQKKG